MLESIIIGTLSQMGVEYSRSGDNYVLTTCLNPLHNDKHPSFSINTEEGYGKCFSCGFSIKSDYWLDGKTGEEIEKLKEGIYKNTITKKLKGGRGTDVKLCDYEDIDKKRIPINTGVVKKKYRGITVETYNKIGAYGCKEGFYKDRIVFPMLSIDGRLCAFNTRSLSPAVQPKYLYSKGFQPRLSMFPYYTEPIEEGYIILVEGIYDAISLYQDGLPVHFNSGLAYNFSMEKISKFIELGIFTIYVMFDDDIRGVEGEAEIINNVELSKFFTVKSAKELPALKQFYNDKDSKDYNEYLVRRG